MLSLNRVLRALWAALFLGLWPLYALAQISGSGGVPVPVINGDCLIGQNGQDLSLPDLNGVEVAAQARAKGCKAPIIAVSGAMPLIDGGSLAKAEFAAAVAKPVRLSALIELVRQHAEPVTALRK